MRDGLAQQLIPHYRPSYGPDDAEAAAAVVQRGWTAGGGPECQSLEAELIRYFGAEDAVLTGSGSSAIEMALRSVGATGGEVAMPAYACPSLQRAVFRAGATPRLLDVNWADLSVSPDDMVKGVAGCAAFLLIHQFGLPALASEHLDCLAVPVVEDVTTALGATIDQRIVGGRGRLTVLSMAATKVLAAGEGGAVIGLRGDVEQIREWVSPDTEPRQAGPCIRSVMSDLCAAIGRRQLAKLPTALQRRAEIAGRLAATAERLGLSIVRPRSGHTGSWWRFLVLLGHPKAAEIVRLGPTLGVTFALPVSELSTPDELFPVSAELHRRLVSIPAYVGLTAEELSRIELALEQVTAWSV